MYISHNDDDETVLVMPETPPIHTANIIPSFVPSSFLSFPVLAPRPPPHPQFPNPPILSPPSFPFYPLHLPPPPPFPLARTPLDAQKSPKTDRHDDGDADSDGGGAAETAVVADGSG